MTNNYLLIALGITILVSVSHRVFAQKSVTLQNDRLEVTWKKQENEYRISYIQIKDEAGSLQLPQPSGLYTILYSQNLPDSIISSSFPEDVRNFPDPIYKYTRKHWLNNLKPVAMNQAGDEISFFPREAVKRGDHVIFLHDTEQATIQADWSISEAYINDIVVKLRLTAKKAGYYSLVTPSLASIPESELKWGVIPGHFQGATINPNLMLSYGYGQGIPDEPVIVRERTASTLTAMITNKSGLTLAVTPEPGYGRDPWLKDRQTHRDWLLGLSLMNRKRQLTPAAHHPILGEQKSWLNTGDTIDFQFIYTLKQEDWHATYQHVVNDIYRFPEFLALKKTKQSLTDRIFAMQHYLKDGRTSLWRTEVFKGLEIGAQAYLGGVVGSEKDAMKNSDYGAMWMVAKLTGDTLLSQSRLPFARNFKLTQQERENPFFLGAAAGQYYLSKGRRFTEEWGDYVEPIGLTYYIMLDVGNMLLYNPTDKALQEELRLGAEKLMDWQLPGGNWEFAYDHESQKPVFDDLTDFRPTFYGLLVAYRVLGDKKYLDAAKKGADWYISNAVDRACFVGVCGDARFAPDFATGQSAQALLDLYELTGEQRYVDAAIKAAQFYTTSVYTHPIPSRKLKTVKGFTREDWEISQVGLSFEHGGNLGSAMEFGPILLSSHNGMFVRMFTLTGDSLFLNMARTSAWGRDAFVDPKTNVASYYWTKMDSGPGPFPHHAWWQIGWITDYLMAEIEMRSQGKIKFDRGFITPKVGPHQPYGFAPGKVFEDEAQLFLSESFVTVSNPAVDYLMAKSTDGNSTFLFLLNNSVAAQDTRLTFSGRSDLTNADLLDEAGTPIDRLPLTKGSGSVILPSTSLRVIRIVNSESLVLE